MNLPKFSINDQIIGIDNENNPYAGVIASIGVKIESETYFFTYYIKLLDQHLDGIKEYIVGISDEKVYAYKKQNENDWSLVEKLNLPTSREW